MSRGSILLLYKDKTVFIDENNRNKIRGVELPGKLIPGIKIHDTRMLRLMETLLHDSTLVQAWRTAEIHQALTKQFGLTAAYTLAQLRYDLRKLTAHGLLERDGKRYRYRLTGKGARVA